MIDHGGADNLPTQFSELVGCRLPLQLAPMGGGVGTPELALAVCDAGGLGMLSSAHPMPLDEQMEFVEGSTDAPYGVGFFAFDVPTRLPDLERAAARARVVDLFWGAPDPSLVERIHAGGALAVWQVGSRDEAVAAADAGCDAVVVQGVEAGGHVRGTTRLLELIDEVVPLVGVPVVGAGGLATGAQVRRVFEAGASAVRVGTRLLASVESAAHAEYLAALISAGAADTELTTAFHVGWEDAPHRVLHSAITAAEDAPDPVAEVVFGQQQWPVAKWSPQPPSEFCTGHVTAMAMYAGTGVSDIAEIRPAADIIAALLEPTRSAGPRRGSPPTRR